MRTIEAQVILNHFTERMCRCCVPSATKLHVPYRQQQSCMCRTYMYMRYVLYIVQQYTKTGMGRGDSIDGKCEKGRDERENRLMSRRDWRENGSEEIQRKNNFNGKENRREKKWKQGRRELNEHENVFVYVRVCVCTRARVALHISYSF